MKDRLIEAGLNFFRATGLDRAASVLTRGQGAILMFHNVRPAKPSAYAPNLPLEITPQFLEITIELLLRLKYEIVPISDLATRLASNDGRRFAALTFDDGYRDNLEFAAPILRRHAAPYAIYVTTGFVDRTARLWWLELELAIASLDHIDIEIAGERFSVSARTPAEKFKAYLGAYGFLRRHDEAAMLDRINDLLARSGAQTNFADLCMTWDEVRTAARDPLCTIGAHTLTHARLAKHNDSVVRQELLASREILEREIGKSVVHLAYPFGDNLSAGPREFAIAQECGYQTAVTTRPGVLFPEHCRYMTALPRLAVHGGWQNSRSLESLLTGVPFALWNLGRRINVS